MALQLPQWTPDPTPQAPFPAVGIDTWIVRNLWDYLVFENNEQQHHFIRSSTRQLIAYLNAQKANHTAWQTQNNVPGAPRQGKLPFARVSGASGVGKSTEVYAWLQTMEGGKVFIHKPDEATPASSTASFVSMGSSRPAVAGEVRPNLKKEAMKEEDVLIYLDNPDNLISIIVADGACSAAFFTSIMYRAFRRRAFLVVCVSGQSTPTSTACLNQFASGVYPGSNKVINSFVVDGFTLAEYAAAQRIVVHNFVDDTQLLRQERFYYAEGCARLYYSCETIEEIKSILTAKLRSVAGRNGLAVEEAASSLRTFVDGDCFVVSEFASKQLAGEVNRSFISRAANTLRDDPSWQRWVAELDLLHRARSCHSCALAHADRLRTGRSTWEVRKIEGNRHVVAWRLNITSFIDYADPAEDLAAYRPSVADIERDPGTVLFFAPTDWNDCSFDAVALFFLEGKRKASGGPRITPVVKVLRCSLAADRSQPKRSGEIAKFLAGLFPLNAQGTYSLAAQANFNQPRIEYSVLTRYDEYAALGLERGSAEVSGLDQLRRWQPGFDLPANAARYYFDHDCDYREGANVFPAL